MSKVFDPEFIEKCREEFKSADANGDGFIDFDEFKAGTGCTDAQVDEIKAVFERFDTDGNGKMDFDEFVAMASVFEELADDESVDEDRAAFFMIDKDHNGVITPDEFFEFVKLTNPGAPYTMEHIEATFRLFDTNGDGLIDFDEFKLMTSATKASIADGEVDQDRASFAFIDKDGNGVIDPNELLEFLNITVPDAGITMDNVKELFDKFDTNSDGTIDFDEFKEMMKQIKN